MFKWIKNRLKTLTFFEVFISFSVVVLVVFVIKYFGIQVKWKTIRVEIINKSWAENYNPYGYRTPFWLSDKLKIGQKEYGKSGKVIAEIINIENYERGGEEADVYLTVKVRTNYQKQTHQYFFKEKPLELGSAIELSPDQNLVYGQIVDTDVSPNGYPQKTFIVTARGRSYQDNFIDKIKVNASMDNRYTQQPVITIMDFHLENPSRLFINENDGASTVGLKTNQATKDIVVKFKITANNIDGRWYFAGHQQLKVGNVIYFYGKDVTFTSETENVEQL